MERLDVICDITANIPGPVDSGTKKWTGDVDSAWDTFWGIRQTLGFAGGDSVFLPDMSSYRAARVFLDEQLGADEVQKMIAEAEGRPK